MGPALAVPAVHQLNLVILPASSTAALNIYQIFSSASDENLIAKIDIQ